MANIQNSVVLTKGSTQAEVKQYFNAILALSQQQTDNKFLINLDEVWPLVYAEKGKAVRALTENFIQGIDYEVFAQNGKNPQGGRPTTDYMLTVSCLEYFIARKVRAVFEVYRQVFHKVAENAMQPVLPQTYKEALAHLLLQVEANEKLQLENKSQAAKIEQQGQRIEQQGREIAVMKSKNDYLDLILSSREKVVTTQIAADYGMSAVKFNQKLAEYGVQRKVNGQWILYGKHQGKGYTASDTVAITHRDGRKDFVMHTTWTQKGRLFLYNVLKRHGIVPMIERERTA